MNPLATQQCSPNPAALDAARVAVELTQLPGWTLAHGRIEKTYRFANYYETLAFVNALAYVAHRQDHHPDLLVSYNHCTVRYHTHTVAGLSLNDFICAAHIEALRPTH